MKNYPGFQMFFNVFIPLSPISPQGTCVFVYTFGRGQKWVGRVMGGLDITPFHTIHCQTHLSHTINDFCFVDDHH